MKLSFTGDLTGNRQFIGDKRNASAGTPVPVPNSPVGESMCPKGTVSWFNPRSNSIICVPKSSYSNPHPQFPVPPIGTSYPSGGGTVNPSGTAGGGRFFGADGSDFFQTHRISW